MSLRAGAEQRPWTSHVGLIRPTLLGRSDIGDELPGVLRCPRVGALEVGDPQWGPSRPEEVPDCLELEKFSLDRHAPHANEGDLPHGRLSSPGEAPRDRRRDEEQGVPGRAAHNQGLSLNSSPVMSGDPWMRDRRTSSTV